MIRPIIDKIVTQLKTLTFTDKVGGVVRTIEVRKSTQTGDVVKRFPVINNSNNGKYIEYLPESSLKSLHFFTERGTNLITHNKNYDIYEANVRLFNWYNLKKINPDFLNGNKLDRIIMSTIPETIANFDGYTRIGIERVSDVAKSSSLWSEWTINDIEKQFTNYPFDISCIDLKITFAYNFDCLTDIELKNIPCS